MGLTDLLNGSGWRQDPGRPGPCDGPPGPVVPFPAAGPGDDCDAQIAPILTGRLDHDLLGSLAARLTRPGGPWAQTGPAPAGSGCGRPGCGTSGAAGDPDPGGLGRAAARELIARHAVALLSGPTGLAAWLRTGTLPPPAATISLPLDIGAVTDLIPAHLRRAIITRDRHCAAPGCDTPPAACHVHHIIPRSQGGTTSLANCLLLCSFHHLILIHRWGWTITLHPDGTTTITSPHGRTLHSHSPPPATAA
jgi:hypothetical protein